METLDGQPRQPEPQTFQFLSRRAVFMETLEKRVAIIHRIIIPDEDFPKEYAVVVTDRRSVLIRQKKTRSSFVLRGEMRYGTALVTDVAPKTLEDYEKTTLESLASDSGNLTIPHSSVLSLILKKEVPKFRLRDTFIWLTMRRQGEIFQVYYLEITYQKDQNEQRKLQMYMVPLGAYVKPRRQTQTRETILREYALEGMQSYLQVLPAGIVSSQPLST